MALQRKIEITTDLDALAEHASAHNEEGCTRCLCGRLVFTGRRLVMLKKQALAWGATPDEIGDVMEKLLVESL